MVAALGPSHAQSSARVLKYGLWAIKNLAARNAANRAQLGDHGACEGTCLFFPSCFFVSVLGTYNSPCVLLSALWVVAVVIAALSPLAQSSADIAEQGMGAIRSLSFDNASNIKALVEAEACTGRLAPLYFSRSHIRCFIFIPTCSYCGHDTGARHDERNSCKGWVPLHRQPHLSECRMPGCQWEAVR